MVEQLTGDRYRIDLRLRCDQLRFDAAPSAHWLWLALLVSCDYHIPLLSHPYPGNQNDAALFASLTETLLSRCQQLAQECEDITLVFDGGNTSRANLEALQASPYHFITSLTVTQHEDQTASMIHGGGQPLIHGQSPVAVCVVSASGSGAGQGYAEHPCRSISTRSPRGSTSQILRFRWSESDGALVFDFTPIGQRTSACNAGVWASASCAPPWSDQDIILSPWRAFKQMKNWHGRPFTGPIRRERVLLCAGTR